MMTCEWQVGQVDDSLGYSFLTSWEDKSLLASSSKCGFGRVGCLQLDGFIVNRFLI